MYKETKETIATILITALVVGGGMYAYFNYSADTTEVTEPENIEVDVVPETEKVTEEEVEDSEEIIKKTNPEQSETSYTDELIGFGNAQVSFMHPKSWGAIDKGNSESPSWKTMVFKKANGTEMAHLNCPIPETGFGIGYNVFKQEQSEQNGKVSELRLLLRDEDEAPIQPGEDTALAVILINNESNNWQDTCMLIAHTKDSDPTAFFNLYERIFNSLILPQANETTTKVFEPKTFENNGYGYTIDYPKNWYWSHPGKLSDNIPDAVGFGPAPIMDGSEYMGSIVIQIFTDSKQKMVSQQKQWLENVETKDFTLDGSIQVTQVRGTMPAGGMQMGSTDVIIAIFFTRNGKTFTIQAIGPTPEDEKIFSQMVDSLRFLN